jgi:hypothetical protein
MLTKTLKALARQSVIGYGNQTHAIYNALKQLTCNDAITRCISFS